MTQYELAAACGVSQPTVSLWESGKSPTYANLQRIASALKTTTAWLVMPEVEVGEC